MQENDAQDNDSVDTFVSRQSPDFKCTTNEIVGLIRQQLDNAEERVEWGMAVFSRDGVDIAGVGVQDDECCLYVPQDDLANEFESSLGEVRRDGEHLKFAKLDDIRRRELKRLFKSQSDETPPQ